ncbi:MAG TPA: molybdopterin cofactor-binding domain-containing protein [Myxococcales bacterium]|nr:molybdopterin cofactor-binding domain-containing protein [Myxococcales bacterium]
MNRREFLASATGLFLYFPVSDLFAQERDRVAPKLPYPQDFNAYLHIGPDGRVGCFVGKVEMGQGVMTSLAMLVAQELDLPLDRVDMVMGDTDLCPWDLGTFGSLTVWQFGPVLRGAAAEARAVLLQLAAEKLGASPGELQVKDGVVGKPGGPGLTFAQLASGGRIERHLAGVKPKPLAAPAGKPVPRKDGHDKVTGAARYAADVALPGMLHARLLRPPSHGAKRTSLDTSAAERLARVVVDGDLVAALHRDRDVADQAVKQIRATWDEPAAPVSDVTIFEHLLATAPQPEVVAASGSIADGDKLATQIVESTWEHAYGAHAPIEPHAAVARLENGRFTVWASTQAPFLVRTQVAKALGIEERSVRIVTPYVGGGFGGKTMALQAVEAARLARITGSAVQVAWDRGEEFFLDTFRPAAVVHIRTGLTAEKRIAFWDCAVVGAGGREAQHFYSIPHQRITSAGGWQGGNPEGMHPFAVGAWRAPSANTNVFARESQIDALAAKAGLDPLAFRLQHVPPRVARVLRAAEKAFGRDWRPAPAGRGFGLACAAYRDTLVAGMAEVAVDRSSGRVRVGRVVLAQDMGAVIDPEGARQQMEGSAVMGVGYALSEEVRFQGSRILDRGFGSYAIPRFSDVPRIETVLVDDPDLAPQGGGEPAITVMGALIANAIHDATGARLHRLPMTPERVLAALQGV